jgi:hypothetical protein
MSAAARLAGVPWRRLALALAIGVAGGAVFQWFRIPLGWMLGAMFLSTAAALAGARFAMPRPLNASMIVVLGVLLGGGFAPDFFERVQRWTTTVLGLLPYMLVVIVACYLYLKRLIGYDSRTALFSAYPGGFVEMVTIGREMGADVRTIALIHSARVLITVFSLPIWFRVVEGVVAPPDLSFGAGRTAPTLEDLGVLALCAAIGVVAARAVRLPGGVLLGPLFLSAAAHMAGLTEARPPGWLVAVAQVIVGTGIGALFLGIPRRQVLSTFAVGVGMVAIMLSATFLCGFGLALLTGLPGPTIALAYAPGGLSEMGLIALVLGIDVAFVATHHVVRMLLIVVTAPVAARMMTRRHGPPPPP